MKNFLVISVVSLVFSGLAIVELEQSRAWAHCLSVSWPTATDCWVADQNGVFSIPAQETPVATGLRTTVVADADNHPFDIIHAVAIGLSENIEDEDPAPDVNPDTWEDIEESTLLVSAVQGALTLKGQSEGGEIEISTYSSPWACSGNHPITIKKNGDTCP